MQYGKTYKYYVIDIDIMLILLLVTNIIVSTVKLDESLALETNITFSQSNMKTIEIALYKIYSETTPNVVDIYKI